jgi:hypothetical protein
MALIPHKADPNYEQRMKEYQKDNSRWGGSDMNKGMPPAKPNPEQGHRPGMPSDGKGGTRAQ